MEMLIVVFVILLVLSIGGNTYRDQRKHLQFTNAIVKVNSMIKLAREYTVTSRSVYDEECQPVGEEAYVPAEGYGVYIERSDTLGLSRIVLFANTQADNESEINQYNVIGGAPCNSDLIEEDYLLPIEVDFVELSVDQKLPNHTPINGITTNDKAVIIFSPPVADTTIAANDNPGDPNSLVMLDDLYMHFRRPDSDVSTASYYIHINHIAGFPEIEIE